MSWDIQAQITLDPSSFQNISYPNLAIQSVVFADGNSFNGNYLAAGDPAETWTAPPPGDINYPVKFSVNDVVSGKLLRFDIPDGCGSKINKNDPTISATILDPVNITLNTNGFLQCT